MSFLEHLDELRKRLVITAGSLLCGFLFCFAFIQPIFDFIMVPLYEILPDGGRLAYTEPTEAFFLYIKIAALAGFMLATPVILSQVWLFVAPGLYAHEKKFAIPFVGGATSFFVIGALFSHFVLFPMAWTFFAGFATDYMEFIHASSRRSPCMSSCSWRVGSFFRCPSSCSSWLGSVSSARGFLHETSSMPSSLSLFRGHPHTHG